MDILSIIQKKRDKLNLNENEINFFINAYTKTKEITDYQAAALLMAIYINGLNDAETYYLTKAMLNSGKTIDFEGIDDIIIDKHSTGGVGDKVTLILAPLLASLGIKIAKMSGRGLGHTGGTLDKLESIPGYNISISQQDFIDQVNRIGIALIGQTKSLVPADKKLYALRDVTATVESIPLIASSIMSKKLASGADVISLDVKVGSGAFMKDLDQATKLAELMVSIGKMCGKKMSAELTNMDEPLGLAVGNSLEVIEAIDTLNGHGPKDFTELCMEVSAELILDSGLAKSHSEALALAHKQIENKEALHKFVELVEAQGGDGSYVLNPDKFTKAKYVKEVVSNQDGYVTKIDALAIGHAAMYLGGGRAKMDDVIDHAVGIVLNKKVGDYVRKGEPLAYIHSNKEDISLESKCVFDAYKLGKDKIEPKLILKVVK